MTQASGAGSCCPGPAGLFGQLQTIDLQPGPAASLTSLGPDIILHVASLLLVPESILSFRATSRHTRDALDLTGYASLLRRLCPDTILPEPHDSLAALMRTYTAKFHLFMPAEGLSGAWTDDRRYYERIEKAAAEGPTVLLLKHVWWLDIGTTFEGVMPGRYRASCRMWFEQNRRLDWLSASIQLQSSPESSTNTGLSHSVSLRNVVRNSWVVLEFGDFDVMQAGNVHISMQNHLSTIKQGIVWDTVRLHRILA